jgi:hypothetical protein
MLSSVSRTWLVSGIWLATLILVVGTSVAMGARLSTSAFLLMLGLAPAVIALMLLVSAPPPTVAEILYAVTAKDAGR